MVLDGDDWEVPDDMQPKPGQYGFDLDHALSSIVQLSARIAPTAFTAESLGTERAGNGVLIREDGLILAEWRSFGDWFLAGAAANPWQSSCPPQYDCANRSSAADP